MATIAEALELAVKHQQAGHLGYAEEVYRRVLQADPGNAETHNNLGILLAQQNRLDEAAAHFRQALRWQPDHARRLQ